MTEPSKVSTERSLPYPAIGGFNDGLQQLKNVSANRKIDRDLLQKGGIAPNNESKILSAFVALGLIDQKGDLTELGRRVRASDDGDVDALGEAVDSLYQGLFEAIPEGSRSEGRIKNFFKVSYGVSELVANRATIFFIALCRKTNRPLAIAETEKAGRRDGGATVPRTRRQVNGTSGRVEKTRGRERTQLDNPLEASKQAGGTIPIQLVIHLNAETVALDQIQIRTFLRTVLSTLDELEVTPEMQMVGDEE